MIFRIYLDSNYKDLATGHYKKPMYKYEILNILYPCT